nr:MAG TPA: YopX protein [Caudoviricetes sp.]
MIPKYRMWNRITSKLHHVDGLYFDSKEVKYIDEVGISRFVKFENTILMQSTGLHDKNGKEVFVGDVIKCTIGCPHEVYLEKEYGGTFIGGMPAIYLKGITKGYAWTGDEVIIGNIYENPELLEVTE